MLASFEYDAMGRRTRKTVGTAVTQYLYDGANAVQELTVANTVSANVLGGLAMDQWLLRSEGATTRHFLTDALGSTRALADDAAAIRTRYQYEPYGESRTTGDASTNSSQYTGRENDGTGLYYYRARYYHPGVKRFISEDPIGLAGGTNVYAYVKGAPTAFADPTGNCPLCIIPALPMVGEALVIGAAWWLSQQNSSPPSIPSGWDGSTPPAPGWEWRGPDSPGGKRGGWVSPDGDQSLHPDFNHRPPIGPHVDWNDPNGRGWRIFPDGRCEPKR